MYVATVYFTLLLKYLAKGNIKDDLTYEFQFVATLWIKKFLSDGQLKFSIYVCATYATVA